MSLQEAFTVTVRLRARKQIASDAETFRSHVKRLLATADSQASSLGYDREYIKLAVYAFIALLDESVMNSGQPMFSAWHSQPLQQQVFGNLLAGETFFNHLRDLLARQDSEDLADVLEVYQLCMVLGFRGRYADGGGGELEAFKAAVQDKITRIRGSAPPISASWALPEGESVEQKADRLLKPLAVAFGAACLLALLAWIGFSLSLGSQVSDLDNAADSLTTVTGAIAWLVGTRFGRGEEAGAAAGEAPSSEGTWRCG